jgi:hypothetical protein
VLGAAAAAAESPQAPPPRRIPTEELVAQLGDADFAVREAATKRLCSLALDPPAELLAATRSDDPEVRERATAAVRAMRGNVVAARLPRGVRFAERGRADLLVAATAAWDLKADDPRLWEPALAFGRRLLERAEMAGKPDGERAPRECPALFPDFATFEKQRRPAYTRTDVVYDSPDPRNEQPWSLYRSEAVQAPGVMSPAGIANSIIVSRGGVGTRSAVQASVVLANGDVTARTGVYGAVIVCDGDVTVTENHLTRCVVVARGKITAAGRADTCVLAAGGEVTLVEKRPTAGERFNVIKENEPNPLGVTFFELSAVGVEVKAAGGVVEVAAVAAGKPFAAAGARAGDVVAAVNGRRPDGAEGLRRLLRDALAVGAAAVTMTRDGKPVTVTVALPD